MSEQRERRQLVHAMTEIQYRDFMHERLNAGDKRMTVLEGLILENTRLTEANTNSTEESTRLVREVKESVEGLVNVWTVGKKSLMLAKAFSWTVSKLAKWLAPILVVGGTLWALIQKAWPKGGF